MASMTVAVHVEFKWWFKPALYALTVLGVLIGSKGRSTAARWLVDNGANYDCRLIEGGGQMSDAI